MSFISQSQRPKSLRLSQKPGLVLGCWDCPKDPESQHHGVYFSISETQKYGTVPGLWDCPRSLGQSWDVGTVPETQSPNTIPRGGLNFKLRNPKAWDNLGTLGLSQKPGQSWDVGTILKTQSTNTMGFISESKCLE